MTTENTLLYFAYGSNLLTHRLASRTGGAVPRGRATLPGHILRFHKRSKDGTAKADAHLTGNVGDRVIGVLFEIPARGKRGLDRAEGLGKGYKQKTVQVVCEDGTTVEASTYVAEASSIDATLAPSAEYRNMVIDGALEHGLPAGYIDRFMRAFE